MQAHLGQPRASEARAFRHRNSTCHRTLFLHSAARGGGVSASAGTWAARRPASHRALAVRWGRNHPSPNQCDHARVWHRACAAHAARNVLGAAAAVLWRTSFELSTSPCALNEARPSPTEHTCPCDHGKRGAGGVARHGRRSGARVHRPPTVAQWRRHQPHRTHPRKLCARGDGIWRYHDTVAAGGTRMGPSSG